MVMTAVILSYIIFVLVSISISMTAVERMISIVTNIPAKTIYAENRETLIGEIIVPGKEHK